MDLFKWFRAKESDSDAADPMSKPLPDFPHAVDDAWRLLLYAAETGRSVDEATRASILRAKSAASTGWDETIAANLLEALTKLSDELKPVTAESLEASCGRLTKPTTTSLRMWAGFLAVPVVVFSVLGFVTASISDAIRTDITTANELLVKLRSELGTPAVPRKGTPERPELPEGLNESDVITQLQQYAATVRTIDARARQLNLLVIGAVRDPFTRLRWNRNLGELDNQNNQKTLKGMFQLPVGLPNMPQALDTVTTTYQDVRSFGQDVLDLVSVFVWRSHHVPASDSLCSAGHLRLFTAFFRRGIKDADVHAIVEGQLGPVSDRWHWRSGCGIVWQLFHHPRSFDIAPGHRFSCGLRRRCVLFVP